MKVQVAVTREIGELPVDVVELLLQRDDVIVVLLELVLIEQGRIEVAHGRRNMCSVRPGVFGIWKFWTVTPEIQLNRVELSSSAET